MSQMPERIFSDGYGIRVVFDYTDFHIAVGPNVFAAASQHKYDEVIIADFQRINSVFQSNEGDILLFYNNRINRLWILRTMLYFTEEIIYNSETEVLKNQAIETEPNPVIADLIRQSNSVHSEVIYHPRSVEVKKVNPEFVNLVDAGIMLEIDDKLLACFSCHNGFGLIGRTMSLDEIKEDITPFYELIEID